MLVIEQRIGFCAHVPLVMVPVFSYMLLISLHAHIQHNHVQDFELFVLKDYKEYHSLYGLEKFWAFHHYSGIPKGSDIELHPELKQLLEGPFKNLDCFREEQRKRREALDVSMKAVRRHYRLKRDPYAVCLELNVLSLVLLCLAGCAYWVTCGCLLCRPRATTSSSTITIISSSTAIISNTDSISIGSMISTRSSISRVGSNSSRTVQSMG